MVKGFAANEDRDGPRRPDEPLGDLHLTAGGARALRSRLDRHCAESGSLAAAILDESGNQIAEGGSVAIGDKGEIAALAAGAFAATRELAARIGETEFDGLMHHGASRHFCLSPINRDYLLLTIFGSGTGGGVVRLCARRTAPDLDAAIRTMTAPSWHSRSELPSPAPEPVSAPADPDAIWAEA